MYKCRGRQKAGGDQDERIYNQAVILFDPRPLASLSPTLSWRDRELTGKQCALLLFFRVLPWIPWP